MMMVLLHYLWSTVINVMLVLHVHGALLETRCYTVLNLYCTVDPCSGISAVYIIIETGQPYKSVVSL